EAPARHRLAEQDIPVLRRRRARVEGADDGREDLVRGDAHGGRAAAWDAIVVDAPATGHSLQYLRMPQAARETFGAGLVQREATKITNLLRDPRATAVHLVTLAEEMPVIETLEMRAQLTGALGLPLGHVIVNRLHRRRFDPASVERLHAAARMEPSAERALLHCVAERAAEESGW